ncbi:hypothetical protein Tco_1412929, partial [Tanacetum coccineum]
SAITFSRLQRSIQLGTHTRLLAIPTPPPSPITSLLSPLPQITLLPFPVPSPLTTSPTYAKAPLGFWAAEIRLRVASPLPSPTLLPTHHPLPLPAPSTSRRADIPKADIPPQKRLCLTAPTPRFQVGENDAPRHHVPREVRYGITNTWDKLVDAIKEGALTTLERINARVTKLAETHERDTQDLYAHLEDAQDSRLAGDIDNDLGCSGFITTEPVDSSSQSDLGTIGERSSTLADALAERTIQRNTNLNGDGSQGSRSGITRLVHPTRDTVENQVKFATCTLHGIALTWWNTHVKTVGHDTAHESDVVEKYVGGLPDMIQGNVMSTKPKTIKEAVEIANNLMDQKLRTLTKRQIENKKKQDDNFRNNQNQQ